MSSITVRVVNETIRFPLVEVTTDGWLYVMERVSWRGPPRDWDRAEAEADAVVRMQTEKAEEPDSDWPATEGRSCTGREEEEEDDTAVAGRNSSESSLRATREDCCFVLDW